MRDRLTPREAVREFLALVGEASFERDIAAGVGGDLEVDEARRFYALVRESGLAADLQAIRLCEHEIPTKRGATPKIVIRGVRASIVNIEFTDVPPKPVRRRRVRVRTIPAAGRTGRPKRQALARSVQCALDRRHAMMRARHEATSRSPRPPRALALLLLLVGLDAMQVFERKRGPTPTGRARIAWLVERIGTITEDREQSYQARIAKRTR